MLTPSEPPGFRLWPVGSQLSDHRTRDRGPVDSLGRRRIGYPDAPDFRVRTRHLCDPGQRPEGLNRSNHRSGETGGEKPRETGAFRCLVWRATGAGIN